MLNKNSIQPLYKQLMDFFKQVAALCIDRYDQWTKFFYFVAP